MKRFIFSIILTLAIAIGSQHFVITPHEFNQRSISSTSSPSSLYHYEMNLDFYVSERLLENKNLAEMESLIDKQVKSAQTCVEHIFKKRKNINIKITKNDIHWLSDEEFLRVGKDSFIPDLDANGKPIEHLASNKTNHFKVFIGDFQSSFAAPLYNSNVMRFIEKHDILKAFFEQSFINHELINFQLLNGKDDSTYTLESLKQYKDFLNKQSMLEEKVSEKTKHMTYQDSLKLLSSFQLSNVVKITPDVLHETFNDDSNTLIHELFHSFANLTDLYINPQNTQPNLMGAYGGGNTCILNDTQIKDMIEYRKGITR